MTEKNLILVESPGKVQTIQGYLGQNFIVKASVGHIRDLPPNKMSINLETMTPEYQLTERGAKIVQGLLPLVKKVSNVYLATDLDREGESIAWHLMDSLGLKSYHRVSFAEITKPAILRALNSPRTLDMDLVRAQEGRRMLDRIVGYVVSPELAKLQFSGKVSAGRVQSIALKLVVDRHREINKHKIQEFYEIKAEFGAWNSIFDGSHNIPDSVVLKPNEPFRLTDKVTILKLIEALKSYPELVVHSINKKDITRNAPPPFTTSLLQQAASVHLQFSPAYTMKIAQQLYEKGLITYMRTDCTHLSAEAVSSIRDWIKGFINTKGEQYAKLLPNIPNEFKSGESAQEAHEAIRPSNINNLGNSLTGDEKLLYQLIWKRTVACQCSPAIVAQTKIILHSKKIKLHNLPVTFVSVGESNVFLGFKLISGDDKTVEDNDGDGCQQILPEMEVGQVLKPVGYLADSKKTRPPKRYTEASLVKALEAKGVGRPATYAAVLSNIIAKKFITLDSRMLEPTKLGIELYNTLEHARFSFFDYDYTRNIERILDDIARGKIDCVPLLKQELASIRSELSALDSLPKSTTSTRPTREVVTCPVCLGQIDRIKSKTKGIFYLCKKCDYFVESKSDGSIDKSKIPTLSGANCSKCNTRTLLILSGKKGNYCKCVKCKQLCSVKY